MKYYFSLLYLLYSNYVSIQFYSNILFLFMIILLLYWGIFITLREIQYNFSQLFAHSAYKRFDMKNRGEYLNISLLYKLYSVPMTVILIIFYFILVILSILMLRLMRLGTNIDTYEIFYKIIHSVIIMKLLYIVLGIFYIYLLKQYIDTFSSHLYYNVKKLYIYLLQVGGLFDIINYRDGDYKNSYVKRYIENPITRLYYLIRFTDIIYKPITLYDPNRDAHKKSKTLYEFYISRESYKIPEILVPLFYFIQLSKYRNSTFVSLLKKILSGVDPNRWIVLYSFPVILLLLTIFYEYFFKRGILSNIYYILLFVFAYKIYIDLIYFFEEGRYFTYDDSLCIYYYVYDKLDINLNKDAMRAVLSQYAAFTTRKDEAAFNIYIESHLNGNKLIEMIMDPEEYKKYYCSNITFRVKQYVLGRKMVQYTLLFINVIINHFYDKNAYENSKKAFIAILPSMLTINSFLLSKKIIIIISVISVCALWFFPQKFLSLLFIPLTIIYLSKMLFQREINLPVLVILSYSILLISIYIFYTKHFNILYMDDVLWDCGIEITQHFTVQEKVKYFKQYLHYIIYTSNLTPWDKRLFLSMIDFEFINTMINENTTLSELKQLAEDLLYLKPSIIQSNIENLQSMKEFTDGMKMKGKTFYEFIQPLRTFLRRFFT